MKYLYPYECETQALSSPGELQAAIDSNRREGRRQAYTAAPLFGLAGPPPRGTPGPARGPVPGPGPAPPAPTPTPTPTPGLRSAQGSASGLPVHACAQLSPIKKGVRGEGSVKPWEIWGRGYCGVGLKLRKKSFIQSSFIPHLFTQGF